MSEAPGILDQHVLRELFDLGGRDAGFVFELVNSFIARAKEISSLCTQAIDTGDRPEMKSIAHEIKSGSGQIGAMRLHETAAALEDRALEEGIDCTPLAVRFIQEIELTCRALERHASTLRSNPEARTGS